MDVIEAILTRHSVRDFSSRPPADETVMKILEASIRSPSGGNSQPWEVFVASGATLERIRDLYRERSLSGLRGSGGPPPLTAKYRERMAVIRNERLRLLGLDPASPEADKVFIEWGARLFGAPVVVVLCVEKDLGSSRNLEIGLFAQTVCLAAQGYGLDSLIAGTLVTQPDILRRELGIPEDLNIVVGIGIGYAKPDSIINTYRSPRRPIGDVVRYKT